MSALHRSRLLLDRAIGPDDERVVELLDTLVVPEMDEPWRCELVGITNSEGLIYREVVVCSALELVNLAARLNALGYSVDRERKSHSARYGRILSKRREDSASSP